MVSYISVCNPVQITLFKTDCLAGAVEVGNVILFVSVCQRVNETAKLIYSVLEQLLLDMWG